MKDKKNLSKSSIMRLKIGLDRLIDANEKVGAMQVNLAKL